MYNDGYVIVASWLVLIAVWVVGSFTAKRDASGDSNRTLVVVLRLVALGLLIFVLRDPYSDAYVLGRGLFNLGPAAGWIGALLTVVGVAFAIWARLSLGRNWGSRPTQDHKLVTSGAYAHLRHPI